jgi:pentatricopeptide repeat protein
VGAAPRSWQKVVTRPAGQASQPGFSQPMASSQWGYSHPAAGGGLRPTRSRSPLHLAFGVLRRMRARLGGRAPDGVTYNTLVSACVRAGRVGRARAMLRALAAAEAARQVAAAAARDSFGAAAGAQEGAGGSAGAKEGRMPAGGTGAIPAGGDRAGRVLRSPFSRPAPDVIAYTSVIRGMLSAGEPLSEVGICTRSAPRMALVSLAALDCPNPHRPLPVSNAQRRGTALRGVTGPLLGSAP